MKLGYPYYYDDDCSDIAYFSDSVVSNSHVFFIGLIFGMSNRRSLAFAEDGIVAINPFEDPGVIPAGMGKGRMNNMGMGNMNNMGHNMLNRKQISARIAAVSAACGSAARCVPELTEKAIDKGSKNPKTVAVIGCIFVAGWCTGQIVDHILINRFK